MRYLGKMSGRGVITCDGETVGQAGYEFEAFFNAKPKGVTTSGEITLPPGTLATVFGRKKVQLLTDDGKRLDLRFSAKALIPLSDSAHVEVTGGLSQSTHGWLQ